MHGGGGLGEHGGRHGVPGDEQQRAQTPLQRVGVAASPEADWSRGLLRAVVGDVQLGDGHGKQVGEDAELSREPPVSAQRGPHPLLDQAA